MRTQTPYADYESKIEEHTRGLRRAEPKCAVCGKVMKGSRIDRLYCSFRCKMHAYRYRREKAEVEDQIASHAAHIDEQRRLNDEKWQKQGEIRRQNEQEAKRQADLAREVVVPCLCGCETWKVIAPARLFSKRIVKLICMGCAAERSFPESQAPVQIKACPDCHNKDYWTVNRFGELECRICKALHNAPAEGLYRGQP